MGQRCVHYTKRDNGTRVLYAPNQCYWSQYENNPLFVFICNMIRVQSLITMCLLNFRYLNFRDDENTKLYICIRQAPHL